MEQVDWLNELEYEQAKIRIAEATQEELEQFLEAAKKEKQERVSRRYESMMKGYFPNA